MFNLLGLLKWIIGMSSDVIDNNTVEATTQTSPLLSDTNRNTSRVEIYKRLEISWRDSPLNTLKTIFYLRDCRGGKGERRIFYYCIEWMIINHWDEMITNLYLIPEYGTWKDLLVIGFELNSYMDEKNCEIHVDIPNLDKLQNHILYLFSNQLNKDLDDMHLDKKISWAAKWAPNEKGKYDRKNKVALRLARIMGINMKTYRKKYLVPLRKYLETSGIHNDKPIYDSYIEELIISTLDDKRYSAIK